jgi:hypothetical protein
VAGTAVGGRVAALVGAVGAVAADEAAHAVAKSSRRAVAMSERISALCSLLVEQT